MVETGSSNQAPNVDIENGGPAGNVSTEPCIYRVPERLRCANEEAYWPQTVSIGPFHHGKDSLTVTESDKDNYIQHFDQSETEEIVRGQTARLRNCYAETTDEQFNNDEFVRIIRKDAAFIIEVLLRYSFPKKLQDGNDIMLTEPRLSLLRSDLRLLENQLPFFILENLFVPEKITGLSATERAGVSMTTLSYNFFKPLMNIDEETEGNLNDIICSSRPQHFVDLLRNFYVKPSVKSLDKGKMKTVPSIRELQQGEVEFKVLNSSNNLFDINFSGDTKILKIPKVIISHETELTIRNVIAFEQRHHTLAERYMTDYVVFMDRFMSTPEDVKLLVKRKVVENKIVVNPEGTVRPEDSAKHLINLLTEGVIVDPNSFYFANLCEDVDKYCRSPKVVQKTFTAIGLLLSVTANILQAIICAKKNC